MDQGFRTLAVDEIVQDGDQYQDILSGRWYDVVPSMVGRIVGKFNTIRRITNITAFHQYIVDMED